MDTPAELRTTPLHALHVELGAQMGAFAGYDLPIRYPAGVMQEHQHCRAAAALFDVSHMGQIIIRGERRIEALERLVPGDIQSLGMGRLRYSLLTNEKGGIRDDLMITKRADDLFLVVNGACKDADFAWLTANLDGCEAEMLEDRALVALQGPKAVGVIAGFDGRINEQPFMSSVDLSIAGIDCWVSRSGYTGEDGVEISVPADKAADLAKLLLALDDVEPAGLGARDSLRLEAGLCLYGHDIDETTTPVEAGLTWTIGKRRKIEKGFVGAEAIMEQLFEGPKRKRVGIRPAGRAPAREGTEIVGRDGNIIGQITSGGFGPTVGGPVAMGYVATEHAEDGTEVGLVIRGKTHDAVVAPLPFVPKGWK